MKKIVLFLLIVLTTNISFSQENDEYANTLSKMLALSGSQETFKGAIGQILAIYKQQQLNISEEIWTDIEVELSKASFKDLTKMLAPIYQKHLTLEDLNGVIAFFQTPVGKKFAAKTSLITAGTMQVGQQWGMELGEKIEQKIQEKGY